MINYYQEPITLRSGQQSHLYINWRRAMDCVRGVDRLSDLIISFLQFHSLHPDVIVGVAEGGTKLGLITQFKWGKLNASRQFPMMRGKQKDHGPVEDRLFLGKPKGKVLLLEDVTTTGGALNQAIDILKQDPEIEIMGALVLTNRGVNSLEHGIPLYSLSFGEDLLSINQ